MYSKASDKQLANLNAAHTMNLQSKFIVTFAYLYAKAKNMNGHKPDDAE